MEYPTQDSSDSRGDASVFPRLDMRDHLDPRRVSVVMWDFAFLTRHMNGDSFEDYDAVLDQAIERGYNTIRLDPLPHAIDLRKPETILKRGPLDRQPINPWDRPQAFEGPAGVWLIEFMEKLIDRGLHYCLSAWCPAMGPSRSPRNIVELTRCWLDMLREWRARFGFDRCIYVDLSNEFPYFIGSYLKDSIAAHDGRWSPAWNEYVRNDVNACLRTLREEFPEVRFMVSLHGDVRWIDLALELDVMDIHFYADADARFNDRTRFDRIAPELFRNPDLFAEFSRRAMGSHSAMAPMYRARQRAKLAEFASWSQRAGIPLVTTESWASWYYIDHPDLDWNWLLEWAEWSVEDAIDHRMWGWTPHNYCQPQFANWQDVRWHRRLTERFLKSG